MDGAIVRRSSCATWPRRVTPSTAGSGRRCGMPPDYLGFVGGRLDRKANYRGDAEWQEARRKDPGARLIRLNGDKVAVAAGSIAHEQVADGIEAVFLAMDERGSAIFTAGAAAPIQNAVGLPSTATQGPLASAAIALLAPARALLHWHERNGFCTNFGGATMMADAGYRRHCSS